ncbi:hypothetical protein P154DRAFT_540713 [Amniculicola lignicola CBS 123094]|uniref:Probable double zinc ribbon domain-containing protein n=1 Tax=Amniculicola lignicola CBS 123094 TaxID=1392246 RepID=A0A6A5VTC6_9PLEO|nr:hypothetical protein P154DRAFT_540713 [Amniculicola lignicola CBS 123094]
MASNRYNPRFSTLKATTYDKHADGAFFCCRCKNINHINYTSGRHPLGTLTCGCKHVKCSGCTHTNILGCNVTNCDNPVAVPRITSTEVPYGHICPGCGESYRALRAERHKFGSGYDAVLFDDRCCTEYSDHTWLRFSIGNNRDWRADPQACWSRALETRTRHNTEHVTGGPYSTAAPNVPKSSVTSRQPPPPNPYAYPNDQAVSALPGNQSQVTRSMASVAIAASFPSRLQRSGAVRGRGERVRRSGEIFELSEESERGFVDPKFSL